MNIEFTLVRKTKFLSFWESEYYQLKILKPTSENASYEYFVRKKFTPDGIKVHPFLPDIEAGLDGEFWIEVKYAVMHDQIDTFLEAIRIAQDTIGWIKEHELELKT